MRMMRDTGIALLVGATLGCSSVQTNPRDLVGEIVSGRVPWRAEVGTYEIPDYTYKITRHDQSDLPEGTYKAPAHTLIVVPGTNVDSEYRKRMKAYGAKIPPRRLGEAVTGFWDFWKNEVVCPQLDFHGCYWDERDHLDNNINMHHEVTVGRPAKAYLHKH